MAKDTIAFRLEREKKDVLDGIARAMDRDRTYVLNEAVDAYIDACAWQTEHIQEGLRQADAGEFVTDAAVKKAFARWRR